MFTVVPTDADPLGKVCLVDDLYSSLASSPMEAENDTSKI